ncbi:hypothetical protein CSA37_11740 [Candidatus Fermentibacteria bacterium]|nr:MAG: hypothetical protein CSA37_11740 [Candidatus Fermentibacteria bacterium]
MIAAEPAELGMFFAEIGLEASPDEVSLWSEQDFLDILTDFTAASTDTTPTDSLLPLLEELPLHLLVISNTVATECSHS